MMAKPIKLTKTQNKLLSYDFERLEIQLKGLRASIEDSLRLAESVDEIRLRILSTIRGVSREIIPVTASEQVVESILKAKN